MIAYDIDKLSGLRVKYFAINHRRNLFLQGAIKAS